MRVSLVGLSKWFAAVLAVVGVAVCVVFVLLDHRLDVQNDAMRQMLAAMKQYADIAPDSYYPLRSSQPGVYAPDMEEWAKIVRGKAEYEQAQELLAGKDGHILCYLGYAFKSDAQALQILDSLEKDPANLRGGGPTGQEEPWISDPSSPEIDKPHALRKGVGRRFAWAFDFHGLPPTEERLASDIPVLWQMPKGTKDRVLVGYMCGYVELQTYPGEFPMSPLFINRLRGLMGLPQDPEFRNDAPIIPLVRRILSDADRAAPSAPYWQLTHVDFEPSISVGDCRGYRIGFNSDELILFPEESGAVSVSPSTLFGAQAANPWLSIADVGCGMGYHWYGKMSYYGLLFLRQKYDLVNGESLYAAAVKYCKSREPSSQWCHTQSLSRHEAVAACQSPKSLIDYVQAYLVSREVTMCPVAPEIVDAGAILDGANYEGYGSHAYPTPEIMEEAKQCLVKASKADPDGAATVALLYVLRYRCRAPRGEASSEGLALLRKLPPEAVIRLVEFLATHLQDPHEAGLCRHILGKLQSQE